MDRIRLIDTLERVDEGFRGKVYPDSKGIPTIGIGHNLSNPITKSAAYKIVHDDLDEVEVELDSRLPWWRRLDETRQQVIANMCFQMGITRLMKFEKMLDFAMIGKFDDSAREMLDSQWAREDSPKRAIRLAGEWLKGEDHVAVAP